MGRGEGCRREPPEGLADERLEKPSVVKAVTLEVDTMGAQKLSLAASVGTLSLMLRKAGEAEVEARNVTVERAVAPPTEALLKSVASAMATTKTAAAGAL